MRSGNECYIIFAICWHKFLSFFYKSPILEVTKGFFREVSGVLNAACEHGD